jgi:hypothetical protein
MNPMCNKFYGLRVIWLVICNSIGNNLTVDYCGFRSIPSLANDSSNRVIFRIVAFSI